MKELVEQNELIDEHSTQDNQANALQAFDGNLTAPFEDVLEQSVERLNGFGTQFMKATADIHAGVSMWIVTAAGCDQPAVAQAAVSPKGVIIVMGIAQDKGDVRRQFALH